MRSRLPVMAIVSLALAACGGSGGGGGGGAPAPTGLGYALPTPATARYVSGDTVLMDIDAGGQSMQTNVGISATWDVGFALTADGVAVTMNVQDFSARMTQPMGGPMTADEGGITGPLVFNLDRQGNANQVSRPTLAGNAQQFFLALTLTHSFFPGLPGRSVKAGDMWTDTIQYEGPEGAGEVSFRAVVNYTVAGDEMVDGRSVVRLNVVGTSETRSTADIQGMQVDQSLQGELTGYVLWDMNAGLMVESFSESEGSGSLEVSAAPFPMGVRARQRSRTKLVSGM